MADVADPETASALNFYALLGTAAAKSTTLSALKTASARLSRPSFVALINRPASTLLGSTKFSKVERNTVAFRLVARRRDVLTPHLSYRPPPALSPSRSYETHFLLLRAIFFLRNRAVTQLLRETSQLAEFTASR